MSATTSEELRNEEVIRSLYALADGYAKDTSKFVSIFTDEGPAHLAELDDGGKLVMAGPLVERAGGLIVLRTESAAEAMAIAEEDPMVRGAYQTYELGTWLMSNRQNDYRPNLQTGSNQ